MGDPRRFDAQRIAHSDRASPTRSPECPSADASRRLAQHGSGLRQVTPKDYQRALLELKAEREATQMAAAE
jgi:hypothetical protein